MICFRKYNLDNSCACPPCLVIRINNYISGKSSLTPLYGKCAHGQTRDEEDSKSYINYARDCQNCRLDKHDSGQIPMSEQDAINLRIALNRATALKRKYVEPGTRFLKGAA